MINSHFIKLPNYKTTTKADQQVLMCRTAAISKIYYVCKQNYRSHVSSTCWFILIESTVKLKLLIRIDAILDYSLNPSKATTTRRRPQETKAVL